MQNQQHESFLHHGKEREHDDGTNDDNDGNHDDEETLVETRLFLQQALTCPLSLESMRDPVVLCCTDPRQHCYGHVYDRKSLCQSLLAHPNLDPKSNIRYTAPLFYVPCFWLKSYLQRKGLYQPHDDSRFATAYEWAWRRRHLFPDSPPQAAANAKYHHYHHPRHPINDDEYNNPQRHAMMMMMQQRDAAQLDKGLLRYLWGATVLALYLNIFSNKDKGSDHDPSSSAFVISFAWSALTLWAIGLICYQERFGHDAVTTASVAVLVLLVLMLQKHN